MSETIIPEILPAKSKSARTRLGKDQRNKFIAEFQANGKIDSDEYYAIKDKNDKIQIRRYRQKHSSSDEYRQKHSSSDEAVETPREQPEPEPKPKKIPKEKTL